MGALAHQPFGVLRSALVQAPQLSGTRHPLLRRRSAFGKALSGESSGQSMSTSCPSTGSCEKRCSVQTLDGKKGFLGGEGAAAS